MGKVFVEYAILPEFRHAYLAFILERQALDKRLCVYEGTDQPGLFVETWEPVSHEEYVSMRANRQSGDNPVWSDMHSWVKGGSAKLNIWHFHEIYNPLSGN
ncbi:hypothetical protein [Paenibacillus sp. FJAT-26967]|uniref:hypothetical protein n=1 Tax=Paenibacillus sp. FJAT-26967 TaxID=1729690 RepID=UPI000837C690|nr:hypothetical protein [Paenibacillus sp. FJAT-26967]